MVPDAILPCAHCIQTGLSQDEQRLQVPASKDNLQGTFRYLHRPDEFSGGTVHEQLACRKPDVPMTVLQEAFSALFGKYLHLG
jgi:hypothetical protein